MGLAFAFGWTPRIGPILGSILFYASFMRRSRTRSAREWGFSPAYSAGLGVPFVVAGLAVNRFPGLTRIG